MTPTERRLLAVLPPNGRRTLGRIAYDAALSDLEATSGAHSLRAAGLLTAERHGQPVGRIALAAVLQLTDAGRQVRAGLLQGKAA